MTSAATSSSAPQADLPDALIEAVGGLDVQEANPGDPTATRDLAAAMRNLADTFLTAGHHAAGRRHAEDGLALARGLFNAAPTDPTTIRDLLSALRQCAQAAIMSGNFTQALEHLAEAIALARGSAVADAGTADLPVLLLLHAEVTSELGDYRAAMRRLHEALDVLQELRESGRNGEAVSATRRMLVVKMRSAAMQLDTQAAEFARLGDVATAIGLHTEALDAYRRICSLDPSDVRSTHAQWVCLSYLGQAHRTAGDLDRARRFHVEALRLADSLTGVETMRDQAWRQSAMSLSNLADIETALGRPDSAFDLQSEALSIFRRQHFELGDDPEVARGLAVRLVAMGDAERALGRPGNAQYAYFEASDHFRGLAERDAGTRRNRRDLVACLVRWSEARLELVDREGAADLLNEARTVVEDLLESDEDWARQAMSDLDERMAGIDVATDEGVR